VILQAYRDMQRASLEGRTDRLDALLDDAFTLQHITGYVQSKREWLSQIDSGQMRYHANQEKSVDVKVTGNTAVLVARNVVTATIYGSRGTWNLEVRADYARKNGSWIAMRSVAGTF
jgi:hypothetical protein